MPKELSKFYEPSQVEKRIYDFWIERGVFKAADKTKKKSYCIVLPPPNVTGVLHMGHALNHTLQDVLIRWKRMQGFETLWQPGTDHAGIATQNVVEREILKKEKKSRHDLGREKLVEKIWEWKELFGDQIVKQQHKIGDSCDWDRMRFTLDEGLSLGVRECFITLYERGLIYRGKYIVNWCPRCHTALADDEVDHEEKEGHLWHIRYPLKEGLAAGFVTVATTRPETMLGDVAVAVNPKDVRYTRFVGKQLSLPMCHREIPVITDDFVDPKFGTGCVKVTPAHDPNDFQIGLRHNLQQLNIMDASAAMNDQVPEKYRGLSREACRKILVEDLEKAGLLEAVEAHANSVGHCYRCHTVVEPWLSEQWFVKMKPLAQKAIKATKKKEVQFVPDRWEKFYLSWLENVRDWCISRQIWWGHRIPVWYCEKGCDPTVSREDPIACHQCGGEKLKQDPDVLDTWFSSALWPFSTLGWPDKTDSLKTYYPNDVLITDRGIIFFWVARMVMMGEELMGEAPFHHVYIHGTILDAQGRKMSKSHPETCIDPLDIVGRYGADALRYSLLLMTTEGQDLKLSESKFETGRNFCNKLWNATRFALMNLQHYDGKTAEEKGLTLADRWIWNRFNFVVRQMSEALENYKYFDASQILYKFVWNEFCDWYLELIKPVIASNHATQWNLHRLLDGILRLAHPFLPFVTEELWQALRGNEKEVLAMAAFPKSEKKSVFQKEAEEMNLVQEVITAIRNLRGEHSVNPKQKIPAVICAPKIVEKILEKHQNYIADLAQIENLQFGKKPEKTAVAVSGEIEIYVPYEKLFNLNEEKERLHKEIAKIQNEIGRIEGHLKNKSFVDKAPEAVVAKERESLAAFQEKQSKLEKALAELN